MTPCALLNYPDVIIRRLLSEWLYLPVITKLDTAFCCSSTRRNFLSIAYGSCIVYVNTMTKEVSDTLSNFETIQWLLRRGVLVSNVRIDLKRRPINFVPVFCDFIHRLGGKLKCIDIGFSNDTDVWETMLRHVSDSCPDLRILDMQNCVIGDINVFPRLFARCPGIIRLSLLQTSIQQLSANVMKSITDHCTNLRCIEIDFLVIGDEAFGTMIARCPHLELLDVSYCPNLSDSGLVNIAKNCPRIDTLTIIQCSVSDASLVVIARHCHFLRSIALSPTNFFAVTDAAIEAISAHCPALIELTLYECGNVTDTSIIALARSCSCLQKLHLSLVRNVTDIGILALAEYGNTHLEELALLDSPRVTDVSLSQIYERCLRLHCLRIDPRLTTVSGALSDIFGGILVHEQALEDEYY